ncbi:MAG: hypothetical protein AB3N22_14285 [Ruegeria sp.]
MAEERLTGPQLKKMVKLGKKMAIQFGYAPHKDMEATVLLVHRRKPPPMLGKAARKMAEAKKFSFGTFQVKGKIVEMTCERLVPMMAKTVKRYLKSNKIHVNVVIMGPDGSVVESDISDLPDDPEWDEGDEPVDGAPAEEEAPEAEPDPDAERKKELTSRVQAVQPRVAEVRGDAGKRLKEVMLGAIEKIRAGDLDGADKSIRAVEQALDKLESAAPDPAALAARAKELKAAIGALPEPAKSRLLEVFDEAVQMIRDGKLAEADAKMTRIEQVAEKAAQAPAQMADIAPTLPIWREARDEVNEQLGKLQDAMKKSGMPLFAQIADAGLNSITETRLVALQASMMDLDGAADAGAQQAARKKLQAALTDMRGFVETNPVLPMLDENPLNIPLTLRSTLTGALDSLDRAIAA